MAGRTWGQKQVSALESAKGHYIHASAQIREQRKEPTGACLGLFFFPATLLNNLLMGWYHSHSHSEWAFLISKPYVQVYSKACLWMSLLGDSKSSHLDNKD